MNKNIEKEYKILVTKSQFESLMKLYDHLEVAQQENVYYDTADGLVKAANGSMRIRHKNGKYIFTLKIKHPEGHLELEKEVSDGNPLHLWNDPEIAQWFQEYSITGELVELGRLKTKRALYRDELAELCFDISEYHGITDYEIEYEYLQAHDGRTRFNQILSHINLKYETNCISKIGRMMNSR